MWVPLRTHCPTTAQEGYYIRVVKNALLALEVHDPTALHPALTAAAVYTNRAVWYIVQKRRPGERQERKKLTGLN